MPLTFDSGTSYRPAAFIIAWEQLDDSKALIKIKNRFRLQRDIWAQKYQKLAFLCSNFPKKQNTGEKNFCYKK
jgi:hypothetical protein